VSTEELPPSRPAIGPYRVIRPLARGGMAGVYEVEDPETGARLALKLLAQAGTAAPRFDREYAALTRLDHPAIVRAYRYGHTPEGEPFLTMERVDGVPAQVYAKQLGRPGAPERTARVLAVGAQVARALAYLHDRGLVHRDLKSSNVLVRPDGAVKLLDFGTARRLDPADAITRHGEFVGTYAYAAPEQLAGRPVDHRADLYSLGVLLYRLLAGRRPFEGATPQELARQHLEVEPPPLDEKVAGLPAAVAALVGHLLAKDPAGRPSSAWVVAEALEGRAEPGAPQATRPDLLGREGVLAVVESWLDLGADGVAMLLLAAEGAGAGAVLDATAALGRARGRGVLRVAARPGALTDALRGIGAATLAAAAAAGPLLVAVDALPALARGEVEALAAAVGSVAGLRVVAATGPEGRAEGLPAVLRVALEPFDAEGTGRLVAALLGRRWAPPGLVARVHTASGGRPGLTVELVHEAVRAGLVRAEPQPDGRVCWRDRSGGRLVAPYAREARLAAARDALGPEARALCTVLAAVDGPLPARLVGAAARLGPAALAEALSEARALGIAEEVGGSLCLTLGLHRDRLREAAGAAGRRAVAVALAAAGGPPEDGEDRVRILLLAGHPGLGRAALAWADAAADDGRLAGAGPLLGRVVDALPPDEPARAALVARRAAADAYADPDADAAQPTAHPGWSALTAGRLGEAASSLSGAGVWESWAAARARLLGGAVAEVSAWAARELPPPGVRGATWAAAVRSDALRLEGRITEARAVLRPLLDAARCRAPSELHGALLLRMLHLHLDLFQLGEGRELLRELEAAELPAGPAPLRLSREAARGRLLLLADDAAGAVALMQPAAREARRRGLAALCGRLEVLLGAALTEVGMHGDGDDVARRGFAALTAAGDRAGLVQMAPFRLRAGGAAMPPEPVWGPLRGWMVSEAVRLGRAEAEVAGAVWARDREGVGEGAAAAVARAEAALADLGAVLDITDRAALAVHPLRRRLDGRSH